VVVMCLKEPVESLYDFIVNCVFLLLQAGFSLNNRSTSQNIPNILCKSEVQIYI
jgi:hypothetical protein